MGFSTSGMGLFDGFWGFMDERGWGLGGNNRQSWRWIASGIRTQIPLQTWIITNLPISLGSNKTIYHDYRTHGRCNHRETANEY